MTANIQHVAHSAAPQPLIADASHAQPYPAQLLGSLRETVEAAQRVSQAPLAIAAQSALSIVSLAVQGFANVETLGGDRPLSLFALTIARSGERKSSVDRHLSGKLESFNRTTSEPTTDGLIRLLASTPSAGLFSDEGGHSWVVTRCEQHRRAGPLPRSTHFGMGGKSGLIVRRRKSFCETGVWPCTS